MLKQLKRLLMVALVSAPFGAAALPIVSVTSGPLTDLGPNPEATTVSGAVYENVAGSVSGLRRSPYDTSAALRDTALYTSVSGSATAEYEFGSSRSLLSLLWGSPDQYNVLEFFLGDVLQGTVGGAQVASQTGVPAGRGYGFVTVTGLKFDSVKFSNNPRSNAFEFAGLSAVPLPGAVWLFGSFLLGLAGYNSRKRRVRRA